MVMAAAVLYHVSLDCPFPFDSKHTIVLVCSEFKITYNPISASSTIKDFGL